MIHPVVQDNLVVILVAECGMRGKEAADVSAKIINGLQRRGMDIVRGDWMNDTAERMPREDKWTTLARDAADWINGPASPLNRSELR